MPSSRTIASPSSHRVSADAGAAVLSLADEIQCYLQAHPAAADTAEHIARWWLLRQRAEAALWLTQDALDHLEATGVVRCSAAGVYRLHGGTSS